jgi:hypothetical protein
MGAIMVRRVGAGLMLGVVLMLTVVLTVGRSAGAPSPIPPTPRPASDGGVALSIAGIDCGHHLATGEYCYVTFRAVNISDGFPVFTEADQTAYDPDGRAYRPDPAVDAVINPGKPVTQRLLRGVPVSGILAFALPPGDRIDHLTLHGKPGTPGETFIPSR